MSERTWVLRRLIAKDWRYIRAYAAASWVAVLSAWLWVRVPVEQSSGAFVHEALAVLLAMVTLARLLQLDSALDARSFWRTRPISAAPLLASKLVVGVGAVLLPCLVLAVLPLARSGIALTGSDWATAFAAVSSRFLFVAWLVLIAATLTRTLAQATIGAVLAGALYTLARQGAVWAWPRLLPSASVLPGGRELLLGAHALVFVYILFRGRRLASAASFLVIGALTIVALTRTSLPEVAASSGAARADGASAPAMPPLSLKVDFVPGKAWWGRSGTRGSAAESTMRVHARFHGMPAGLSLVQIGYTVHAMVPNRVLGAQEFIVAAARLTGSVPGSIPNAWQAAWQCPRNFADRREGQGLDGGVEIFRETVYSFGARAWRREPGKPTPRPTPPIERISGTLRFEVVRATIAARSRVDGGVLSFRAGRVLASRTQTAPPDPGLTVRYETLWTAPWPAPGPQPFELHLGFYDPESGDCVFPQGLRSQGDAGYWRPLRVTERRYGTWSRNGNDPETAPLPGATEVGLLELQPLGAIDVPFDYRASDDATTP
jgi:hypothetical protein